MLSLLNMAASSGRRRLCKNGVLASDTATNAPAVADNIATPVKPNQSHNQCPDFPLNSFLGTGLLGFCLE
jgi:hypothetical protein